MKNNIFLQDMPVLMSEVKKVLRLQIEYLGVIRKIW